MCDQDKVFMLAKKYGEEIGWLPGKTTSLIIDLIKMASKYDLDTNHCCIVAKIFKNLCKHFPIDYPRALANIPECCFED